MTKSRCEASASCTWVKSYKTKEGVTVDAYCRAKSGKAINDSKEKGTGKKKSEKKDSTKSKKKDTTKKKSDKSKKKSADKKKSDGSKKQ